MQRTLSLVLAAVSFSGSLRLSADTITLNCPAWTFAGPFTVVSNIVGGNALTNLFRPAPMITAVYVWNASIQDFEVFVNESFAAISWSPYTAVLNVQDVVFVSCPVDHTFTWTTVDTPPAPSQPFNLESNRYYLRGPSFYGNSTYEDLAGAPPTDGTSLFRYVGGGNFPSFPPGPPSWQAYHFLDGAWTPSTPVLHPLEGALIVHPTLRISAATTGSPPSLVLSWPRGTLEMADQVSGPWQDVTNSQSPYVVGPVATGGPSRFYRVRE